MSQPTPLFDELMCSEDTFKGITAFAAERAPQWQNR